MNQDSFVRMLLMEEFNEDIYVLCKHLTGPFIIVWWNWVKQLSHTDERRGLWTSSSGKWKAHPVQSHNVGLKAETLIVTQLLSSTAVARALTWPCTHMWLCMHTYTHRQNRAFVKGAP